MKEHTAQGINTRQPAGSREPGIGPVSLSERTRKDIPPVGDTQATGEECSLQTDASAPDEKLKDEPEGLDLVLVVGMPVQGASAKAVNRMTLCRSSERMRWNADSATAQYVKAATLQPNRSQYRNSPRLLAACVAHAGAVSVLSRRRGEFSILIESVTSNSTPIEIATIRSARAKRVEARWRVAARLRRAKVSPSREPPAASLPFRRDQVFHRSPEGHKFGAVILTTPEHCSIIVYRAH